MSEVRFDYFRGMEAEQYSFYRVPKVLFTEECFKKISCEAKILYGLLLDRMSLSIKNRWFDEKNRAYIIFTVNEIAELLNCGTQKVVKLLKELDTEAGIGLIEKKRLGLGKPNVIYVKNFIARTVEDGMEENKREEKMPKKLVNTQNSENHNSRVVKTTIQEVSESQFQNDENHNSGVVKIISQEVPKSQCNKTDINKTESSKNNQSYPIYQDSEEVETTIDAIDKMNAYREIVRENISYESFVNQSSYVKREVDELVELIVEVMMMPDKWSVRIAGEDKPVALVKNRFMKLTYSHIEYVRFSLQKNTTKVGNIKAYLLTTLYNSLFTIDHFYQAEVQHDMYGGV
jgi:hypothetical protein